MIVANGFYTYAIFRFFWKHYRIHYARAILKPIARKFFPRFFGSSETHEEAELTTEFVLKSKKFKGANRTKDFLEMIKKISSEKQKGSRKSVQLLRPAKFIDDGYENGYFSPISSEEEEDGSNFSNVFTGNMKLE